MPASVTLRLKIRWNTQESFYRELTDQEKSLAEKGFFDFDHPNAFDADLMEKCLQVGIFN